MLYVDPADPACVVGLNPLAAARGANDHLVAGAVVESLIAFWRDSRGPGMEYILYNCLATLLARGGATILGVHRLLVDDAWRRQALQIIRDEAVRSFWLREFDRYPARLRQEAIAPVQNKTGRLITHPMLRAILGQVRPTYDPRRAMAEGGGVLVNRSKGRVGADAATLLGSLHLAGYSLQAQ